MSSMLLISDSHFSRHKNGSAHLKSDDLNLLQPINGCESLEELDTFEFGPTMAINPGAVAKGQLWREYNKQEADGFFAVDLRIYNKGSMPNFSVAWVNPNAFNQWVDSIKIYKQCQIYAYIDSAPWLCLSVHSAHKKLIPNP